MSLLEKVYNAKLTDTKSLQTQLDNITFSAQQLALAGYPINNKVLGCILAFHLPDSYATLRTVLTTQRTAAVTSKWVTDQILAEEHHRISKSGGTASAYYANAKKGKPSEGSTNTSNMICSYCKKLGHKKVDCRKCKKAKENRDAKANGTPTDTSTSNNTPNASKPSSSGTNSNSGTSAKIAVANPSPADDTVRLFRALAIPCPTPAPAPPPVPVIERLHITRELVLQAQAKHGSGDLTNGWIIDSGASRNMCAHRDWFHQYSSLSSPIDIILGDDSSIQATGVGRISVRMSANSVSSPAILQDVLHVPELHGNLLSVSQFACRGSEIRFVSKGCSILDQRRQVICNGDLRGNLYVMHIQTISTVESAHVTMLDSFPAEGEDLPETALLVESPAS